MEYRKRIENRPSLSLSQVLLDFLWRKARGYVLGSTYLSRFPLEGIFNGNVICKFKNYLGKNVFGICLSLSNRKFIQDNLFVIFQNVWIYGWVEM